MSKKENVTGRFHWQGKAHTRSKNWRFFCSPITGDYHDSCDFIRKIAFTFVEKNGIGMFQVLKCSGVLLEKIKGGRQ